MNEIMNEVPDIITGKDLDYLTDVFNWNYNLVKKANSYVEESEDEEIKQSIKNVYDLGLESLNHVLNVLGEKGNIYE